MVKTPPVFVELVGATLLQTETDKGYSFEFGDNECWAPKAYTQIIDDKVYVAQWLARDNAHKWNGAFVPGSRRTQMKPDIPEDADLEKQIDEAIDTLDELRRALRKRMKKREEDDQ